MADESTARTSDQKLIQEALVRFKEADEADQEQRRLRAADVAFANGDSDNLAQWDAELVAKRRMPGKPQRPCITDNRVAPQIRQVTNEQRQNKPAAKARPVDNDADKEVAEIFDGIIRHVEDVSNADTAYQKAGDYQTAGGVGYFRLVTEYCDPESFDQEFRILPIADPDRVRMDPFIETPEGSDQQYAFVFEDMPLREFEAKYPDHIPQGWDITDCAEWVTTETVRVAEYLRLEHETYTLARLDSGEIVRDPLDTPEVKEHIVETRTVRRPTVHWYKLTAGAVLDHAPQPFDAIPVFRVVGTELYVDGKRITKGMTRDVKDSQRLVNYYTSNEAEVVALQPKSPWVAARGQIENYRAEWDAANTDPVSVLVYDPVVEEQSGVLVPPPQRAAPPLMSAAFVQGKLGAIDAVKSGTNVFDAAMGQRSNETSGVAIRQRDLQTETSNFHYIDNLAKAIKQCGRLIVQAAPKVYRGRQVARIIGEDGTDSLVKLNWAQDRPLVKRQADNGDTESYYNLGIGKYDVTITVGPSFSTKRQESAAFMTELARSDPTLMQKAGDIITRNFDVPGADQLADRLRKFLPPQVLDDEDSKNDPEVRLQQAQAMLQQMEQALQNADQIATKLQEETRKAVSERDAMRGDMEAKLAKAETDRDRVALEARQQVQEARLEAEKLALEREKVAADIEVERAKLALEREKLELEKIKLLAEANRVEQERAEKDAEKRGQEEDKQAETSKLDGLMEAFSQMSERMNAPKQIRLTRSNGQLSGVQIGDTSMAVVRDGDGNITLQ